MSVPRLRLGLLLWLAGVLGAVVMTVTVLPQVFRTLPLPAPLWVVSLASIAQSAVLIALAVWAGVALAGKVGLHAPAFEALAARRPLAPGLRPQLLPGLVAGFLGGILLFSVNRSAPAALGQLQEQFTPPLLARLLYGGFTEEILLRWGFMTVVIWLAWRLLQRRTGAPRICLYLVRHRHQRAGVRCRSFAGGGHADRDADGKGRDLRQSWRTRFSACCSGTCSGGTAWKRR